jgi:hypothetical protein
MCAAFCPSVLTARRVYQRSTESIFELSATGQRDNFCAIATRTNLKMLRKHSVLLVGLAFAVSAMVAWQSALKAYTRSLGMIKSSESSYHINLEHVAQHMAAHREQTLEQWLGPVGAQNARQQQAQYRGRFAAALLCGFMTVFCLGMYLDALKRQRPGAGPFKMDAASAN